MKLCYLIPQCNHNIGEAKVIRDLIKENHGFIRSKKVIDKGKHALAIVMQKAIPEEDLLALGLSAPVGEAYADQLLS